MQTERSSKLFNELLETRILIMDGAMGTMLRTPSSVATEPCDLLSLSDPGQVRDLHRLYLNSGADILRTNTFNSNPLSLPHLSGDIIRKLNTAGIQIARNVAASTDRNCFVAGVLGPTPLNPDGRPAASLVDAFYTQSATLIDAGAQLLIAETITHPKTGAAFQEALKRLSHRRNEWVPAIVSIAPIGKIPVAAFLDHLKDYRLMAIGLNCSLAGDMEPALEDLAVNTALPLCVYPSAGLPDSRGRYPEDTEHMVSTILGFALRGMLNIVGGCCGTTPAFTRALAKALTGVVPRRWNTPE